MAITNHERVGKALELLREGLLPFVERELSSNTANTGSPKSPRTGSTTSTGRKTPTCPTWTPPSCCA